MKTTSEFKIPRPKSRNDVAGQPLRGNLQKPLYNEAKEELVGGNYKKAIDYYEKLGARFPYGRYSQQAQLELGYAYFKNREPAQALAASDRFIKLHPDHPNVDYAYYLKGLVNFNEDLGLFGSLANQDPSERDPKAMRESFDAFREMVIRFPDCRYTPDAYARMRYLVNAMANFEASVAYYYMRRKAYVAAISRAQGVLLDYPQSPAVERALAIMVKSYDAIGGQYVRHLSASWRTYVFPHMKDVCTELHRYGPDVKIYSHICRNILPIVEDLVEVGLDCIGPLDPLGGFTPAEIRQRVGDSVALMGGCGYSLFHQ